MPRIRRERTPVTNLSQPPFVHQVNFLGSSATFTQAVMIVPTGGLRNISAKIVPSATIAAHADNHWTFTLQAVGGTDIAVRSTDSDADGVLTADTVYALTPVASEQDQAAGTVIELLCTGAGAPVDQSATRFTLMIEAQPL